MDGSWVVDRLAQSIENVRPSIVEWHRRFEALSAAQLDMFPGIRRHNDGPLNEATTLMDAADERILSNAINCLFLFQGCGLCRYFKPRAWASTRYALSNSPLAGNGPRSFRNRNLKLSAMELNRRNSAYARVTQCV